MPPATGRRLILCCSRKLLYSSPASVMFCRKRSFASTFDETSAFGNLKLASYLCRGNLQTPVRGWTQKPPDV